MSVLALIAPVFLIAAMLLLIAYARRQFRPKVKDDRDLAAHLGVGDLAAGTPRRKPGSTPGSVRDTDRGGGAPREQGGRRGGDGGD